MRRRRAWFIALSIALLSACVGAWKWSERPPYGFMAGMELWFIEEPAGVYLGTGSYIQTYVLVTDPRGVRESAKRELGVPAYEDQDRIVFPLQNRDATMHIFFNRGTMRELTCFRMLPMIPANTQATIEIIDEHPAPFVRARAWVYRLQLLGWRGAFW